MVERIAGINYICSRYLRASTTLYMDNLKQFNTMASEDNWRTPNFRQTVVSKIEEAIQRLGVQVTRNSSEMENYLFMKAKTLEEYMKMVAKLILHVREISQAKKNQNASNMQPNQNQPGPNTQQNQQGQAPQGPYSEGMAPDPPINALQNLVLVQEAERPTFKPID